MACFCFLRWDKIHICFCVTGLKLFGMSYFFLNDQAKFWVVVFAKFDVNKSDRSWASSAGLLADSDKHSAVKHCCHLIQSPTPSGSCKATQRALLPPAAAAKLDDRRPSQLGRRNLFKATAANNILTLWMQLITFMAPTKRNYYFCAWQMRFAVAGWVVRRCTSTQCSLARDFLPHCIAHATQEPSHVSQTWLYWQVLVVLRNRQAVFIRMNITAYTITDTDHSTTLQSAFTRPCLVSMPGLDRHAIGHYIRLIENNRSVSPNTTHPKKTPLIITLVRIERRRETHNVSLWRRAPTRQTPNQGQQGL